MCCFDWWGEEISSNIAKDSEHSLTDSEYKQHTTLNWTLKVEHGYKDDLLDM